MRLAKTFAIVAVAGLMLAGVIGSALRAYAQDVEEINPNASSWSAGADSAEQASPEAKEPGARAWSCITGDVDDTAEGAGNVAFLFAADHSLRYFFFVWNEENFAQGSMTIGSISSKRIDFAGSAGNDCSVTGNGKGEDWELSGKYKFHGKCENFFQEGTFSISIPCFGEFDLEKKWQANN